jgi:hypothetical protein
MATAPAPLVSTGDFVYTGTTLCYVESIENKLGWNTYNLVDLDSGRKLQKARHELILPDIKLLDDILEGGDAGEENNKNAGNNSGKGSKRFAEITDSELDDLAINRNSKKTRNQTTWAVSIFKGETPV